MINVLILMSGSSQSFKDAGYTYPKNLVEIDDVPLVQRVLSHLNSLKPLGATFICVLRRDENNKHRTGAVIGLLEPTAKLVELNSDTSGAACSALMAVDLINNDDPLIVLNGDQIIDADLRVIVQEFTDRQLDGGIVAFEAVHPRWSFVKCDADGRVVETAEKRPISNLATAGFYYFRKGCDFVKASTEMIKKDAHVNGLFYICPVYNELILAQKEVGVSIIPRAAYRSLASPADVHAYEAHLDLSRKQSAISHTGH